MATINNDYRVLQRFLELQDWVANNIKANVNIPSGSSTIPLASLKIGNQIYSITGGGGGSLTGIGLSMPSAFTVSPSGLITQTGTFTVEMADGFKIPETTEVTKWNSLNQVIANTSETATIPLTSLKVGDTVYSITGGGGGGGDGTVTSVRLTMPTGFTVNGSPITTSGTLAVTMTDGYEIPTTVNTTKWNSLTFNPTVPSGTTPISLTTLLYNNTYYSLSGGSISSVDLSYVKASNITTGISLSVDDTVTSTLNTQNNININNNADLQKLATAYGVYKSAVMPQPTIESGQSTYQIPNFTQNNIMVGGSNPTIGDSHNYYIKDSGYSITTTIDTTTTQSNSLPTVEAVKTYVQGVISSMTYNGELE